MIIIFNAIYYLIAWSVVGGLILGLCGTLDKFSDFSFINPIKIYKTYKVNYFGAAIICIIHNLLCPIASIGYWFYKLCTFGRK